MGYNHRDYAVVILRNNVQLRVNEPYTEKAFNSEVKIKVGLKIVLTLNVELLFLIYQNDST